MIYYVKQMSRQKAFQGMDCIKTALPVSEKLCRRVLSLPLHPYIGQEEQEMVVSSINKYFNIKE